MLKVDNTHVYGLSNAIEIARYPMVADVEEYRKNIDYDKAIRNARNLANSGNSEGHNQFLTGITVTFDVTASAQWWPEAQRYKFLNFISSTSKMHKASEMDLNKCCNKYVSLSAISNAIFYKARYLEAKNKYHNKEISKKDLDERFYEMIYNLPLGFEYTAGMITNYRCLRNIYFQRRNHRLEEWHIFCDWIETLPMADKLITVGYRKERVNK